MALQSSPVYSDANARILVSASNISYQDENACRAWAAQNGFDGNFDFLDTSLTLPGTGTQGFVAEDASTLLIAFRGTQPAQIADDTTDAKAVRRPWAGLGSVHDGFLSAFFDAYGRDPAAPTTALRSRIQNRGAKKIWITGHSLGGGLAQICAAQLALIENIPVEAVYTYGQPRVGDAPFAARMQAALGDRTWRLVNDRDIVPRVPFYISMGYRHFGREEFFSQAKQRSETPSRVETLEDALESFRQTLGLDALGGAIGSILRNLLHPDLADDPLQALQHIESNLDLKSIAKESGENITDHLMKTGYLTLFPGLTT